MIGQKGTSCHICQGVRVEVRGTRPGEDHKVPHLHHPQEEGEENLTPPQMMIMTTAGVVMSAGMRA